MASSESWLIVNPRHNNRDLVISVRGSDGELVTLRILTPGQSYAPDRAYVFIEERKQPPRWTLDKKGKYVRDQTSPKNIRKIT